MFKLRQREELLRKLRLFQEQQPADDLLPMTKEEIDELRVQRALDEAARRADAEPPNQPES